MTINRATSFSFTLYGKQFISRTQAKTVGDLLKEKGVNLGAADGVSPSKETSMTSSMDVRVWRNGKQTVTQEEVIARPVEQVMNADMAVGVREVQDAGADGTRNTTYEIETKDGVEVSRVKIASVTTLEAIKQVVVVGTKVLLPAGSHTDWMAAAGIAASDYGYVDFIVGHESGWNPCKRYGGVVDCSYSGGLAYGIPQALPGSKMSSAGADWQTNPITQLRWMNSYVNRFGGWKGAYDYWQIHHSY
jgi:resuscitation-promoting factor RpfB